MGEHYFPSYKVWAWAVWAVTLVLLAAAWTVMLVGDGDGWCLMLCGSANITAAVAVALTCRSFAVELMTLTRVAFSAQPPTPLRRLD